MATSVSYPGVYIEELPSAVRTITAVTTSVTAFVGATRRGPIDEAVTITSFADFERQYGGLDVKSLLSYAVQQFFLVGGSVAVIVRVAKGAEPASQDIAAGGEPKALTVTSRDASAWGNGLRVAIDPGATDDTFAVRVLDASGTVLERYRNLSMDSDGPRFVEAVVNESSYINTKATGDTVPDFSGTVSGPLDTLPDLADKKLTATVDGVEPVEITLYTAADTRPASLTGLGLLLERRLRAASPSRAFTRADVDVAGKRLQVLAGTAGATMTLTGEVANLLGLTTAHATAYALTGGDDGVPPTDAEFRGSEGDKTGVHALREVQDVNLLCLPDLAGQDYAGDAISVITTAEELCEDKRMLLIVDSPPEWTSIEQARTGLPTYDAVRSDHAALYFPHITMTDPLTGRLRTFPPSGAVAGLMARTDAERGVWKAPAGTDVRLTGVRSMSVRMSDAENGLLNPLGVNCLRTFPIVGPVIWGARTLLGADALASQWKYVPVRRLAFMLEESLYRGLKWVVFEPNDEPLWGQIRLNVGAFLHNLFTQGAFQGKASRDAYFVKCDKDTTTQDDINRGIVNVIVGFAPLKPAEFVVVKIEQMAGRIEV
ncbi:phage tail sheath subtilisin-like domain-containing protein [Streptomyces albipurpureus]|uniref:Phage tail sheath subtilisin-like domain-containing protein n=1 Tax=Streptomyces albipurpureus TaxID=2897419 RepID=A0ABT0UGY2_9ACTN|nr:phage tail sheath subtilisin-like domain-containing protein [Streptomyces sp. CWNU-1]MCM2387467.1 phage tail sheath subtilisin-like domain-containing protein [Streptomyces sp. CWNU-1]